VEVDEFINVPGRAEQIAQVRELIDHYSIMRMQRAFEERNGSP
jgi:hypothetical protein